jgi:peptide/nickel transport system permease protein
MVRSVLRQPVGLASVVVLVLVGLLGLFGPLLAPFNPLAQDTSSLLAAPSPAHLLGTDDLGRDVLSRLLAGSPLSLLAAVEAVAVGLVLGVVPGLLSVLLGRGFEWAALRVMDSLMTLPFLVFAIAMSALLGNGLHQAMFAVGILVAPGFFRVTRAAALAHYRSPYVEASLLLGASTVWIVRTHLWRKIAPTIAVSTAGMLGAGLVIVSSLTFLGIGVQPPEQTWGGILATDLRFLYQRPYGPLIPGLLIVLTVGAFNGLADALRDGARAAGRAVATARILPVAENRTIERTARVR